MMMDENQNLDLDMDQEPDIVELTDDEGNVIPMQVVDYFFYNGEEFVILADMEETEDDEDISCYVMKVTVSTDENGEELESFEPIEDADFEAKLIEVANAQLEEDDEV